MSTQLQAQDDKAKLTQADVAKQLQCSVDHVHALVRRGKLKEADLGKRFKRYRQEWVDEMLEKSSQ